jgi:GPH family glycoside/pentoside/hexuronide:cation symporter
MTQAAATATHGHYQASPLRDQTIAWASGSFGQAIAYNLFTTLFFRFLTDQVAIPAAAVGAIIGFSKVYSAGLTPCVGWLSDKFRSPFGRRRPLMFMGGIILAIAIVTAFHVDGRLPLSGRELWAEIAVLLFATGYSLYALPWLAMSAEVAANLHARTRMMAWRVGFSSGGQTLATAGGPMLLAWIGANALGYGVMGWTLGALCLLGTLATTLVLREQAPDRSSQRRRPSWENFRGLATDRALIVMVLLKGVLYFGLAMNGASLALITRWAMHLSDAWLGTFALVSAITMLASQPIWVMLSKRFGKHATLTSALVLLALGSATLAFNHGSVPLLMIQAAFFGALGGGVYMLTQSLLPDVIEADAIRHGVARGGIFAGLVTFLETACGALALLALGQILGSAGYQAGMGKVLAQPNSAIDAIRLCGAGIPAAMELACAIILIWWPLHRTRQVVRSVL